MFLVEIFTSKEVWEVYMETPTRDAAFATFLNLVTEGARARLTYLLPEEADENV